MPYKNIEDRKRHDRERYQRMRAELIKALGGKCVIEGCEETRIKKLEAHHIVPYGKRSRPNSKEYFKPEGKELRCKKHHSRTRSWRRKHDRRL